MALEKVIPHAADVFLADDPPWLVVDESPTHYWVGSSPVLSTKDGDGSFARFEPFDPYHSVAARLPPISLDLSEGIQISAQVRYTGPWNTTDGGLTSETVFVMGLGGPGIRFGIWDQTPWPVVPLNEWVEHTIFIGPDDYGGWDNDVIEAAAAGELYLYGTGGEVGSTDYYDVSWLELRTAGTSTVEGVLAIDTHDHPFHVVGTRDPAMPYELVIDTGTERVVEIVAGEEHLATHELVVDETGRPGTPWSHAGLFRPI